MVRTPLTSIVGGKGHAEIDGYAAPAIYNRSFPLKDISTDENNPRHADLTFAGIGYPNIEKVRRLDDESREEWLGRFANHIEEFVRDYGESAREEWESLYELAASISDIGVTQPVVVDASSLKILAGERRYWASMAAGLSDIPALARGVTRTGAATIRYSENHQRRNLSLHGRIESARDVINGLRLKEGDEPFFAPEHLPSKRQLSMILGIKDTAAFQLLKCLELPNHHPVLASIRNGTITKLHKAMEAIKEVELLGVTPDIVKQPASTESFPADATPQDLLSSTESHPNESQDKNGVLLEGLGTKTEQTPPAADRNAQNGSNIEQRDDEPAEQKSSPRPSKTSHEKSGYKPKIALPHLDSVVKFARVIDTLSQMPEAESILNGSEAYDFSSMDGIKLAQLHLKLLFAALEETQQ